LDYENHEVNDSEQTDTDNPKCSRCDNEVFELTEIELIQAKKNFKNKGKETDWRERFRTI